MILLAIDTSGPEGSLALMRTGPEGSLALMRTGPEGSLALMGTGPEGSLALAHSGNIREVRWIKKAMHSEVATLHVQVLLEQSGLKLNQLTHIAVNVGPGSFTGLRVGLSLSKTLAYALELPITSVSSLESLAFTNSLAGESVFVARKAIQNFYYVAGYQRSEGLQETLSPRSVEQPSLAELSASYAKVLIEGQSAGFNPQTRASDLVRFVEKDAAGRGFSDWKYVQALYIRASEAEEKLRKGLLKPV